MVDVLELHSKGSIVNLDCAFLESSFSWKLLFPVTVSPNRDDSCSDGSKRVLTLGQNVNVIYRHHNFLN